MDKTTVYLPDDLKSAIKQAAARQGPPEAEVIRQAIRQVVGDGRPRPRGSVYSSGQPIARRTDELLAYFGAHELTQARSIIAQYGDQDIGVADASNVVLAERYGTRNIETVDRCHFDVLRPLTGDRFTVLPSVRWPNGPRP